MKNGKDAADFRSENVRRDQQHKDAAFAPSPNVSSWSTTTLLKDVPSGLFYSITAPVLDRLAKYINSRIYDVATGLDCYQEAEQDLSMYGTTGTAAPELYRLGVAAVERVRKREQRSGKLEKAIRKLPTPKPGHGYNADGLKETDEDE